MSFCGNVLELVEKYKVFEGYVEFVKWDSIEENPDVEVYMEKSIIPELEEKGIIVIDAIVSEVKGKKMGLLLMKKLNTDTYG
ncbi:MAG: hypothetical protein ACFFBP_03710 [Promethearchaeota archaeon]